MKFQRWLLLYLLTILLPLGADAQAWSGILSPARAVDWSSAGVSGGIPNRTSICATIEPYGTRSLPVSAAAINNAIQNCPAGQVVSLRPGSFFLSSGITFKNKSNVTVRGAGADQTFIYFFGTDSCGGAYSDVCFIDSTGFFFGSTPVQPGGTNSASWSSGYSGGATAIQLSNVGSTGIVNGQYIVLDQANDQADNGNFLVCSNNTFPCALEGGGPGRVVSGHVRNQQQIVRVVGGCPKICSGKGPFTLTISPGLYAQQWSSSKAPGAWWTGTLLNSGIENVSLDHTDSGIISGIAFVNAYNCWLSGVRSVMGGRNHVWLTEAAHNTIQSSYFYGTKSAGVTSYGVESYQASDNLVVNNIFERVTSSIMMGPAVGNVYIYNFGIDGFFAGTATLSPMIWGGHDGGVMYNLYEGNIGTGFNQDVFHGSTNAQTLFRNYFNGYEFGKTGGINSFDICSYNRYDNFVGNVLGQVGVQTVYQNYPNCTNGCIGTPIYTLGRGNSEGSITIPSDKLVYTKLMRWGNYDTVNGTAQWNGSEVPSNLTDGYANPVPSNQTLPASFYYSSRPSFWITPWGTSPWPAIGPDVTGGAAIAPDMTGKVTAPGGHAYSIPAQLCYENTAVDSIYPGAADRGVVVFSANKCYGTTVVGTSPNAPTHLAAAVQ